MYLHEGERFLDIGAGVATLSLAMLREWPALRVVAVEPLPEALVLASAAIHAASAGMRVELRAGYAQDLQDTAVFDLAFIPSAFIPPVQLQDVAAHAARALRPGGWLLMAVLGAGADRAATALTRFRVAAWGGTCLDQADVRALLGQVGLEEMRFLSGAGAAINFAAARRPGR